MQDLYTRTLRNLAGVHPELVRVVMRSLDIGGLTFHVEHAREPDYRPVPIGYGVDVAHAIDIRPIEDESFAAWLIASAAHDEGVEIAWFGWTMTMPDEARPAAAA